MTLIKISTIPLCLSFLLGFHSIVQAEVKFSETLEKRLNYFKKQCDKPYSVEGKLRPNKLLLLDASDPLDPEQIQFLRDNFVGDNITWKNEGDKFSIVLLDDKKTAQLDFISLCAPLPENQITFTMAKNKVKQQIKAFKWSLTEGFEALAASTTEANHTPLIETIIEIHRNKRYGFTDGDKSLILASDLYQNSEFLSFFYNVCREKKKYTVATNRCKSFKNTLKMISSKNQQFFKTQAKFDIKPTETIEIYHLKSNGEVNLTAKDWWVDYLKFAGYKKDNIKFISQLD